MEAIIKEAEIREIYRDADTLTKGALKRIFGQDVFNQRRLLGVWCVNDAGVCSGNIRHELIPFDGWDTEKHTRPECVAVITEDTAFLIGLHNTVVAQWGQKSNSTKLITDIESLDSKAATDAIIEASRGLIYHDPDGDDECDFVGSPAADFCRKYETAGIGPGKWDLPTVQQLKIMHKYRKEINRCLMAMGFPTLVMGWYWSSIAVEGNDRCAWGVGLGNGGTGSSNRSGRHCVRAVSAFQNLCLID